MILTEWLPKYFALKGARLKPTTLMVYREAAWHMLAAWGSRELGSITRLQVAEFRAGLAQGRSENTVCKLVAACAGIMAEAARLDLVAFNPFDRESVSRPRTAKLWPEVTVEMLDGLLAACPDDAWCCCFALCRLAGLRIGEVRRLRWREIDFSGRSIMVMPEDGREGTKQALRFVPVSPRLLGVLLRAFEAASDGSVGPCAALPAQLYRPAARIVERAGERRWADLFHTLRKSCISEWGSNAAISDRDLVAICGHDRDVAQLIYHRTTRAAWDRIVQP